MRSFSRGAGRAASRWLGRAGIGAVLFVAGCAAIAGLEDPTPDAGTITPPVRGGSSSGGSDGAATLAPPPASDASGDASGDAPTDVGTCALGAINDSCDKNSACCSGACNEAKACAPSCIAPGAGCNPFDTAPCCVGFWCNTSCTACFPAGHPPSAQFYRPSCCSRSVSLDGMTCN